MKIKFKATCQLVTYFFTFLLLLKYKNDFPVVINLPQSFTAMIRAKLRSHVFFPAVSCKTRIANSEGDSNKKCYMAVAWREQPGDPSIVSTESERSDSFEHRVKNQTAVFQSGTFLLQKVETREGIKLKVDLKPLEITQNCVNGWHSIHSSWCFSGRCVNWCSQGHNE